LILITNDVAIIVQEHNVFCFRLISITEITAMAYPYTITDAQSVSGFHSFSWSEHWDSRTTEKTSCCELGLYILFTFQCYFYKHYFHVKSTLYPIHRIRTTAVSIAVLFVMCRDQVLYRRSLLLVWQQDTLSVRLWGAAGFR